MGLSNWAPACFFLRNTTEKLFPGYLSSLEQSCHRCNKEKYGYVLLFGQIFEHIIQHRPRRIKHEKRTKEPLQCNPLWEKSRWITGNWDGVDIESGNDLKSDINGRVAALIKNFWLARNELSDERKTCATNFFVIPEFYFHSVYGPYPNIKIEDKYPYEYILFSIQENLKEDEVWVISIGTVMTCNRSNIPEFLGSEKVQERLEKLNGIIDKHQLKSGRDLLKKNAHTYLCGSVIYELNKDANTMDDFTKSVAEIIKNIPKGKVSTYGRISLMAGQPNGARQVARILHSMSRKHNLPWHRVINIKGFISLPKHSGYYEQKARLQSEGIEFDEKDRVDLEKYLWKLQASK